MTESSDGMRVGVVGIHEAGVRTLIGAMSGSATPATSGMRIWEDANLSFMAARPETVNLDDFDMLAVVVSARQGVPAELAPVWQAAMERGLASIIVVTHIDDSVVDLEEVCAMCQRVLSDGGDIFLPWLPILDDVESVCGFINLLSEEIVEWSDGGPVIHPSESRHQELIEETRAELCEAVMLAVEDDELFAMYMSGTLIDGEVIETQMFEQVARGLRHPVLGTGVRPHLLGIGLVLDTMAELEHSRRH